MQYDLAVFVGRFQPFHQGHLAVVRTALHRAEKLLFIVGSADVGRSTRNPFLYTERRDLISSILQRLHYNHHCTQPAILPARNYPYDDSLWVEQIKGIVSNLAGKSTRIALVGSPRDASTFYLTRFPEWEFIPANEYPGVNATAIRKALFRNDPVKLIWEHLQIPETAAFLMSFMQTQEFKTLCREFYIEGRYRAERGPGPHQTGDAVIVQNGHLLVVERGGDVGNGKLALPGGHLNLDERLEHCVVRECFEETHLFEEVANEEARRQRLWSGFLARERFDDPYRSLRARVITEAFLFELMGADLPKVRGGDDAAEAMWIPVREATPFAMFEDHGYIVERMLSHVGLAGNYDPARDLINQPEFMH